MDFLPRSLDDRLARWRSRRCPKPLLLRGPRQVGKSSLVRSFARGFDHYIELNLEHEPDRRLFRTLPEARPFLDALFARARIRPKPEESVLLFIDEIQQAPPAIQFLRYLYEDQDRVHVIAAGSLLEFTIGEVRSMPVGRIEFVPVYPLSFREFLIWTRRDILAEALDVVPAPDHLHGLLAEAFREYALVGGMPDAVKAYAEGLPVPEIEDIYRGIWTSYTVDLERHASSKSRRRLLRFLLAEAPNQHDRISYANIGGSDYRGREVREGLEVLAMARVLKVVRPTTALEPPALPHTRGKPRLQLMDTGLLNYVTGLQSTTTRLEEVGSVYRGRLGLHIVTQELIASQRGYEYEPHFWIRENKKANAEVDLVYRYGMELLGFEVKSGAQGRLRSLHQFVERAGSRIAVRALDNAASVEDVKTPAGYAYRLLNIPLYATARVKEYVDWALTRSTT